MAIVSVRLEGSSACEPTVVHEVQVGGAVQQPRIGSALAQHRARIRMVLWVQ